MNDLEKQDLKARARSIGTAMAMLFLVACSGVRSAPDLAVTLPDRWHYAPLAQRDETPRKPAAWWLAFHDAALDRLIEMAVDSNLTIAAAAEHLRAARALASVSAAPYLPNLSFATGSPTSPDAKQSYFQTGFDASWELPLFDRAQHARQTLDADAGAAVADLAAAQTTVAAETACAYFTARAAQQRQALFLEQQALARARLVRLQTRARVGLDAPSILHAATSDFLALQANALEPGVTWNQSLQRIAALLGRATIDAAWVPASSAPLAMPALHLDSTPADLLRQRPDVRLAELNVLRAAAALGTAQAELYPHVSLMGAITAATRLSGVAVNTAASAGPVITLPLFDWGMRRAARDARAADVSAAALIYRQTVFDAVADVESILANLNRHAALIDLLQQAAAIREDTARRDAVWRRVGLTDSVESLSTAQEAINGRLNLVEAQYAAVVALVQLHKALGGALVPGES